MANDNNTSDLRPLILTNELGDQMLDMVAPIYDRSKVALYLFQAIGIVLQKETEFIAEDFIAQLFVQTATWGIPLWEEEYGIIPSPSWSLEQRRQNIIATLQYQAPITPKKLADRISAAIGSPASVIENVAPNTFEVVLSKLTLDYTPVRTIIDRIAPAHLIYNIHVEEEEEVYELGNYYKILTTETEECSVVIRNTILTDENDNILINELGEILTV